MRAASVALMQPFVCDIESSKPHVREISPISYLLSTIS
jgi:hypothetical protein